MSTESEESLLAQLEHLILDEDRLVSAKWLAIHMEVHVHMARTLLSRMVAKHEADLSIHHCLTGYKQDAQHSPKVFCIEVVTNQELDVRRASFSELISSDVYSVSKTRDAKDFAQALYHNDYQQTYSVLSSFFAQQQQLGGQSSAPDVLSRFSLIRNNDVDISTVAPPTLHKALAPDVIKPKQSSNNSNHNSNSNSNSNSNQPKSKVSQFKEKVSALQQTKPRTSPLKRKFAGMNMNLKKAAKQAKQGIDSMFAKQTEMQKQKAKTTTESKDQTTEEDIDTEMQETDSKSKATKTEMKPKKPKKKAKKIRAAKTKKRKRGEMETKPKMTSTSNLAPIDYDSESSESERDEAMERAMAEKDAELEAVKSPSKRRKIIGDSDSDCDVNSAPNAKKIDSEGDEDSDMDMRMAEENESDDSEAKAQSKAEAAAAKKAERKAAREAAKAQKAKEKAMAKEKAKADKERLLEHRRANFFGSASKSKSTQRRTQRAVKKYKTIRKSYVNAKGMFVTEDVRVTDNEAEEVGERKKVEVQTHKGQYMERDGEDGDAVMTNKENSAEQQNGMKKQQKVKAVKVKKVSKSPKPKKAAKSGNIMSFFKTK